MLNPRLPMMFGRVDAQPARGARLVVVAGVPGTGKSTLAEGLGRELGFPVFAFDWLLGALTPFGGRQFNDLFGIGNELLTTLAYRQLQLGQSAILDAPFEDAPTRTRLTSLADALGAALRVIVCECSDAHTHQLRLGLRRRSIAGWHEGGNWANVKPRREAFVPWEGGLVVDAMDDSAANLARALEYVRSS